DVSAEKCVHLGEERNQLVALARRKNPTEPLKETRRIAQQEERRDEEYEQLEEEVTEADDERHRAAGHHLREIADPGEIHDQSIEILEADLIGRLSECVLRVGHQGRQRPLNVAHLIDRERNEESAGSDYG